MTPATNAAPPSHNEFLKENSPTLSGTIAQTLADAQADHFSEDDNQFLKFHGSYQQDDRDLRKTGKKYIMMVRSRIPGGVMTANQWRVFDDLSARYGNNTLRITTRQTIQFHGILKSNLRAVIKAINESLLSTLAACGDVNRNVLAPPTPAYTQAREQVFQDCHRVALALAPQTGAYHSIWIDGVQLDLEKPENKNFVDPLYGKTYLPRKFKIAFVIPPVNDLDIFTNCLGLIAIVENDRLIGYNLAVGGGMGRSHGNEPPIRASRMSSAFSNRTNSWKSRRPCSRFTAISATAPTASTPASNMSWPNAAQTWTRAEIEKRASIKLEPAAIQIHHAPATSTAGTRLWTENCF